MSEKEDPTNEENNDKKGKNRFCFPTKLTTAGIMDLPAYPKKIGRPKELFGLPNFFLDVHFFGRPIFVFGRPKDMLDVQFFFGRPKTLLDVQTIFWTSKKKMDVQKNYLDVQKSFLTSKIIDVKKKMTSTFRLMFNVFGHSRFWNPGWF